METLLNNAFNSKLCLVSAEIQGMWENLIFDSSIKLELLNYASTTLLFSDANIDSNIITWNRVVLLHGENCLHGFYDISYDTLPKPSSQRAHYLTLTHEFARTNCLKYCCLHVLPRFWDTLPRHITDLCIDIFVYPFLNTLRNFLFDMPPITQSF